MTLEDVVAARNLTKQVHDTKIVINSLWIKCHNISALFNNHYIKTLHYDIVPLLSYWSRTASHIYGSKVTKIVNKNS